VLAVALLLLFVDGVVLLIAANGRSWVYAVGAITLLVAIAAFRVGLLVVSGMIGE
jgi:hypothetical protein